MSALLSQNHPELKRGVSKTTWSKTGDRGIFYYTCTFHLPLLPHDIQSVEVYDSTFSNGLVLKNGTKIPKNRNTETQYL